MSGSTKAIKERLKVSEVLSEYMRIQTLGTSKRGLCPFHNEKTPSFHISDDRNRWHCFGCGKGGDIFDFLVEHERMDFAEAVKVLAKKAGIELQYDSKEDTKKSQLVHALELASDFWSAVLMRSDYGKEALAYCRQRGLTDQDIQTFRIGFSLDAWNTLSDAMKKKDISESLLFDAGLLVRKEKGSGYYDRFRSRIMFPIADSYGQIIGFTGRIFGADESTAKYVNTPQTEVYDKSATLYGIHLAKDAIRKENLVILVEGQMDVIASHRVGIKNVVAASGTALTEKQIEILKRYTNKVAVCFDSDAAGLKAAQRSFELLWKQDMDVYAVVIQNAKDPDECVKKDPELWKEAVKQKVNIVDFWMQHAQKRHDLLSPEGKRDFNQEIIPLLSQIKNIVVQSHFIQKLSTLVATPEDMLRGLLQKNISETKAPLSAPVTQNQKPLDRKKDIQQERMQRLIALLGSEKSLREIFFEHVEFQKLNGFDDFQEMLSLLQQDIQLWKQYSEMSEYASGMEILQGEIQEMSSDQRLNEFTNLIRGLLQGQNTEYKYELAKIQPILEEFVEKQKSIKN